MSGTVNLDLDMHSVHPPGGLINIGIFGTGINTIIILILFFIVSVLIISILSKSKIIEFRRALLIFSFHSIISAIFITALMTLIVNDLDSYFQIGIIYPEDGYSKYYNSIKTLGILTISQFYRFFYYFFKLDFLAVNILFGCIGSFVLIFYDKLLLQNFNLKKNKKDLRHYLFLLIVFFPSLSVWSGYLGKEILTLTIFICSAFILIKEKSLMLKTLFLLPLVGLLGLIRPHFAFLFIFTLIIYLFLKIFKKSKFKYLLIIISSFFLLVLGQFFIGGDMNFNVVKLVDVFLESGAIQRKYFLPVSEWNDVQNSNPLFLWISFIFTPIFNLENPRNIVISLENIILIIALIILIFNTDIKKLNENDEAKFFIIFFLVTSFVMSIFTYQVGIYWRQKWMLLPYLFIGMSLIQKKNFLNAKK